MLKANEATLQIKELVNYWSFQIRGRKVKPDTETTEGFVFDVMGKFNIKDQGAPRYTLQVPGKVHGGHTDQYEEYLQDGRSFFRATERFSPTMGFWNVFQEKRFVDAIHSIPDYAAVDLEVYMDAGTTECLLKSRIHVDQLILNARWTEEGEVRETHREFLIDTMVGFHNAARFGVKEW